MPNYTTKKNDYQIPRHCVQKAHEHSKNNYNIMCPPYNRKGLLLLKVILTHDGFRKVWHRGLIQFYYTQRDMQLLYIIYNKGKNPLSWGVTLSVPKNSLSRTI